MGVLDMSIDELLGRVRTRDLSFGVDDAISTALIRMRYSDVPNVEDVKRVEVGKTYFVNVVTTRKDCPAQGAYFPVLGDEHDDADFIPIFPDNVPHWHLDWRFI